MASVCVRDPRPQHKRQNKYTNGQNSDSFDPKSTLVRPDMRILHSTNISTYPQKLKHDDVVVVPNFETPDLYQTLLHEMKQLQDLKEKDSEYISWHEGCHLLIKNPEKSQTFQKIIRHMYSHPSQAQ